MASLRCHGDSDCNKTHIIRNFHLYIKQLWKPFFHIFTHCDVVDAQTWEVSPPKKCNRAVLSWLSHPRAREIWPRTNALCPLSKSKRPAKEDILDMARENAHLQQHAWGYFAFKRLLSVAMIELCLWSKRYTTRWVYGPQTAFEWTRSGPPAVFLCSLYFVL